MISSCTLHPAYTSGLALQGIYKYCNIHKSKGIKPCCWLIPSCWLIGICTQAEFEVPIENIRPASPAAPDAQANDEPGPSQRAQTDAMETDGSWVEVADDDVVTAQAKVKAPKDGNVLEGAED